MHRLLLIMKLNVMKISPADSQSLEVNREQKLHPVLLPTSEKRDSWTMYRPNATAVTLGVHLYNVPDTTYMSQP